jgi:hypothetical protein
MQQRKDERSLGDLFAELANETSTLVRQEIQLAKTEVTQKATSAGKDIGFMAAGGAIAYIGAIVLAFALVYALAEFIWLWLAALIVGLVIVGVGYLLIQRGLTALKKIDPTPRETIESLKEDKEWAKEQTR